MKKILLMAFFVFTLKAQAQIAVLEHTYPDAATWNAGQFSQLMLINFEVSGYQYVHINRVNKTMNIYDLNHVLVKTIPLGTLPTTPYYNQLGDLIYITEQLFDPDPKKEFMYVVQQSRANGDLYYLTDIINEDGVILFSDTGAGMIQVNFEQQQFPIYNTPEGTKMILSYATGEAKVFSLRGKLPCNDPCSNRTPSGINGVYSSTYSGGMLSNPYPNPSASTVRINYTLPYGVTNGEIIFYDLQGKEVKRYAVDRTFNSLGISTTDLASGTYYYQLQTPGNFIGERKMVVLK